MKNVFVQTKNLFAFQKQQDLLNMSGYCCFPRFSILPVRVHLTPCLAICLVMIFLLKLLGLKIYFRSPTGIDQVLFLTLELILRIKRRKLILHLNLFKAFIFLTWSKLEAVHEINLLCDRKYKHEVKENREVLAPIIETMSYWENLVCLSVALR